MRSLDCPPTKNDLGGILVLYSDPYIIYISLQNSWQKFCSRVGMASPGRYSNLTEYFDENGNSIVAIDWNFQKSPSSIQPLSSPTGKYKRPRGRNKAKYEGTIVSHVPSPTCVYLRIPIVLEFQNARFLTGSIEHFSC